MARRIVVHAVFCAALIGLLVLTVPTVYAQEPVKTAPVFEVPPVDVAAARAEDMDLERQGLAPRFAIPYETFITPSSEGNWEQLDHDTWRWHLRITSPGALSLNLGFTRYFMPPSGSLLIYATDGGFTIRRPFTAEDNESHGQLWTPVILGDDITLELTIDEQDVAQLALELTSINHGYCFFGEPFPESGWCNIDVICPQGDLWRDEIQTVGVISTGGSTFCTGFAVNNTSEDRTPYFMTAYHCGITSSNASSLVVYWNFQSPTCGQQGGGSLSQWQSGSYWRAGWSTSDFTLVELDDDPDPQFNVYLAGWDNTTNNATSAVAIHHPSTDEKSISFENAPCTTTSYLGTSVPGDGTHVRVIDWDEGTTEPGSSGSPLFDQNHHVVGQLHGGYAACGNDESDWYGRFSKSWPGGGSNSSRLYNWLDPTGTGLTAIDTIPFAPQTGLKVTPVGGLDSQGDPGGPFSPSNIVYTLENLGSTAFDYELSKTQIWVSISNGSGSIPGGGTVYVTVSINSNANSLGYGTYNDTVTFTNLTTHEGDTTRPVTLTVGVPTVQFTWALDSNPGWTTQGQWAYGHPTGGGGQYGSPDPTSGHTGSNVYGYNLNGDYASNIPEYHLTTTAIDCSNLTQVTLKFWRWLGVERNTYDHAYVRVSNNGTTWTTVWENGEELTDSSWTSVEYDISDVADNQPTVYIRWTMGTTDGSWQYCGWNVDDVELWGLGGQSYQPGDLNCDGELNGFDIDPFVLVLGDTPPDYPDYYGSYPDCDHMLADINGDGQINGFDIEPFIDLID
ncbi:MAG: trypsin-like peptidase domain-containing protein [Planctomycetes bacterium]|nr:trypsin-like peptidase domain-containing protein [Planctomycetota bacterium]